MDKLILISAITLAISGCGSSDSKDSDGGEKRSPVTEIQQKISEPDSANDHVNDASPLSIGTELTGSLTEGVDAADYYSFSAPINANLKITLQGPENTDFDISLADSGLNELAMSESDSSDETIRIKTSKAEKLNLLVSTHSGSGSYTLTILEDLSVPANNQGKFVVHHVYNDNYCIELVANEEQDARSALAGDFSLGQCPAKYSGSRCYAERTNLSRDLVFVPSFPDAEKSDICRRNDETLAGSRP